MKSTVTEQANVQARQSLTRWILLKRKATRSELVTDTGLCAASVTNHTRWLLERGLLKSTPIRVPDVKRSVDLLQLNSEHGVLLLITLQSDRVLTCLLDMQGQTLVTFDAAVTTPTQSEIFKVLSQTVHQAKQWAHQAKRVIDHAGMSVRGILVSSSGLVFSMDGVPDWRPCEPKLILPMLNDIPKMNIWTHIKCKMLGFAAQQQTDTLIGYVEYHKGTFHISAMRNGEVRLGEHGTTSSLLHECVDESGPLCYCGRHGCLAQLLETGHTVDQRLLANTFIKIISRARVQTLAMEWEAPQDWLRIMLEESGYNTHWIQDGQTMATDGLHILTAQAALTLKLAFLSQPSLSASTGGQS